MWKDNIVRKVGTTYMRKTLDRQQWRAVMEDCVLRWVETPK